MEVLPEYEFDYTVTDTISGYVNLPQKVLDDLKDASFPLIFRLSTNIGEIIENVMFCGVKEFTESKNMSVPKWMIENLMSPENGKIKVEYVKYIPPGKYIELEPLEEELFGIPDYDIHLERVLSDHCILTQNQIFRINIFDKEFNIKINKVEIDWEETDFEKLIAKYSENIINVVNRDINVNVVNKFYKEPPPPKVEKTSLEIPVKKEEEEKPELKVGGKNLSRKELRQHYINFYDKKNKKN